MSDQNHGLEAHDWQVVFSCPVCRRASGVAAADLAAVMRCPHCRTKVVIDQDGMHRAPRRPRRNRVAGQAERNYDAGHHPRPEREKTKIGSLANALVYTGMIGVLVAAAVPAVLAWSGRGALGGGDGKRDLEAAARSFQSAWLDDDLDAAGAFVEAGDRPRLRSWSVPRRAALAAGFGAAFRARVTGVEIVEFAADQAVVRVAFTIRGREQQVFQTWKLADEHWRLTLGER